MNNSEEESDAQSNQESEKASSQFMKGNFLMVETKDIPSKLSDSQAKELNKKMFRKLHIVSIHDQVGGKALQNSKTKTRGQSLEQID